MSFVPPLLSRLGGVLFSNLQIGISNNQLINYNIDKSVSKKCKVNISINIKKEKARRIIQQALIIISITFFILLLFQHKNRPKY